MFGLGAVGKTSLIHRFLYGKFDDNYTATIEDDYRQVITYNDHIVDVTVLDTAGSYQFPAMRKHAIQNGQGFLLVYAFDNPHSLGEVDRIFTEISSLKAEECNKLPIILVGNKSDIEKRIISNEQISELLQSWQGRVEHIETSAKNNTNVSIIFNKMISIIDDAKTKMEKRKSETVGSINFSTTYDRNSNLCKRTLSVDENSFRRDTANKPGGGGMGRSASINPSIMSPNFSSLPAQSKTDPRYSSQVLSWNKANSCGDTTKDRHETNKVKKKQRAMYGIFSRKFVS